MHTFFFFFSSRRRHTRLVSDWSSDVCSSDLRRGHRSPSTAERSMHERPDEVTPSLLREWPLPDSGNSKYDRGRVLVVGGAARTPGAVQLAGLAALRVGAGHLTMAVAASAAVGLALTTPEAGVV